MILQVKGMGITHQHIGLKLVTALYGVYAPLESAL